MLRTKFRFKRLGLLCALALSMLVAASRVEAAELLSGLGGPAGYGTGNLPGNDDGSTAEIDIRDAFPSGMRFFGMTFTSLYVNNNGNVSFGGPVGVYTPQAFPISDQRMIAPWWGDVDTRGGGTPTRNGVYWSITRGRIVVTWHNVGYYANHDERENDFQLVLTAAGPGVGDFDVEFRYHRCEWTTGDASGGSGGFGGTPAQAGFDAGNTRDYVALPGSLTMAVLQLCTTSNVGDLGVWRYTIRDGSVMCPGMGDACVTTLPGVCAPGRIVCRGTGSVCQSLMMPSTEVCNGLDDDCNRFIDDAIAPRVCYTGPASTRSVGQCRDGTQTCAGGAFAACTGQTLPAMESCNRRDDDCNGLVDDVPGSHVCGVGQCRRAVPNCTAGVIPECVPGAPSTEVCNGLDDDCNGRVDEIGCDAGVDVVSDAGAEAGVDVMMPGPDASECHDYHCDRSLRLDGRAGPFGGCGCRAGAAPREGLLGVIAVAAMMLGRRRRRVAVKFPRASNP